VSRASIASIALWLAGCAASAPEPAAPESPQTVRAQPARTKASARVVRQRLNVDPARPRAGQAAGVSVVSFDARDPSRGQMVVDPALLDLSSLPLATMPEPLDTKYKPLRMPESAAPSELRLDRQAGWSSNYGTVSIGIDSGLARLLIGAVDDDVSASAKVYRTCNADHGGSLEPARWMVLAPDAQGKVVLRVVDAWFDPRTCKAAVVRTTRVAPAPLLGGLVYAFRTRCKACNEGETLTLLSPAVAPVAVSGLGSSAQFSQGSFVVAKLALRRGAASSFGGSVAKGTIDHWFEALGGTRPHGETLFGVDVSHAVGQANPIAIAYATVIR
jgi:hypothetical protein